MARLKIIILDKIGDKLNYAMWADVPAARQVFYANAAKVSAWKDALPADNAALQSGAVVEQVRSTDFAGAENMPEVRTSLIATWNQFQNEINNVNPWKRYGTTYDGAWINGGVT